MNGVKEMHGYRVTFNISYTLTLSSGENGTEQCSSSDDVETSALLVCVPYGDVIFVSFGASSHSGS